MKKCRNTTEKTEGRNADGTFAKGNSGRPKGSRNRIAQTVEKLLGDDIEKVTQAVLNKALKGDMIAAKIVLDRIAPARKESPIKIDIPTIETAQDATQALSKIAEAMSAGDLTPSEAKAAGAVVQTIASAIEISDLEKRIEALEAAPKQ